MDNPTRIEANGQVAILYLGDSLEVLDTLPDNSVDSIVCDPPYELGFMGRKWDATGIAFRPEIWQKCLRVLKPGGHILAFGAPRNYHRLTCAIEDAGFEIRDSLIWLFGTGFPKALDLSKAIDKELGIEREVVGITKPSGKDAAGRANASVFDDGSCGFKQEYSQTKAGSPQAEQWEGWKTALKPQYEPIVLARKPLDGTVAHNVLKHGVGGLNIDACRIGDDIVGWGGNPNQTSYAGFTASKKTEPTLSVGRFPTNILIDAEVATLIDAQSGLSRAPVDDGKRSKGGIWAPSQGGHCGPTYGDFGGASRFFYTAKAQADDRNAGLKEFEERRIDNNEDSDLVGRNNPRNRSNLLRKNTHPTVKPTDLMQYLVRLITPKGGIVLDCFMGSGSCGKAALLERCDFIGIEREPEYFELSKARIKFLDPFSE